MNVRWLRYFLAALFLLMPANAAARPTASQFTVAAGILPVTVANGATATLIVHTRIGSDCTARVTYSDGSTITLVPTRQHVGKTGIIYWHWTVQTTASAAQAFASCQWKRQGRGGFANATIRGHQTLSPTVRPRPARPGVAILGATKAAWEQMFGPYLKSTTADYEGWQACFGGGITPRISAAFREGHAYSVSGAFCTDALPGTGQRLKEASQFFPPDATYLDKYTKSDGSGVDLEYFAASLARAFVPGDFLDCDANLVRPGSFSVSLDISGAMGWQIQAGSCT